MSFTTTITVTELANHLGDPGWAIIDSRFKLANPEQGRIDYESSHIPGAVYAHLDEDLSEPNYQGSHWQASVTQRGKGIYRVFRVWN